MKKALEVGNVVEEFYIGNTRVRICDDYCRNKSQEDVDKILERIGRIALNALQAEEIKRREKA